jgi:hypothetical protein
LGSDDGRLRRAQALASGEPLGVEIARSLLAQKLDGQVAVLAKLNAPATTVAQVRTHRDRVLAAAAIDDMRAAEAAAAIAYWSAWTELRCYFPKSEHSKIPEHWHSFGRRRSLLTPTPRYAVNPINAILNYLYGLLEAEARLGCLTVGLDPSIGLIHTDGKNKPSFALDVIEPARPTVDAYVVELLTSRWFDASDFHETKVGNCRILPPLTHELVASLPTWSTHVGSAIEASARAFATQSPTKMPRIGTPLTEANRKTAKGRRTSQATKREMRPIRPCDRCGGTTGSRTNKYCPDCLEVRRDEQTRSLNERPPEARRGRSQSAETREARGAASRRRDDELQAWIAAGSDDAGIDYDAEIAPLLVGLSPAALARASGMSKSYCHQMIATGKVPHRRHWQPLRTALLSLAMGEQVP